MLLLPFAPLSFLLELTLKESPYACFLGLLLILPVTLLTTIIMLAAQAPKLGRKAEWSCKLITIKEWYPIEDSFTVNDMHMFWIGSCAVTGVVCAHLAHSELDGISAKFCDSCKAA